MNAISIWAERLAYFLGQAMQGKDVDVWERSACIARAEMEINEALGYD